MYDKESDVTNVGKLSEAVWLMQSEQGVHSARTILHFHKSRELSPSRGQTADTI